MSKFIDKVIGEQLYKNITSFIKEVNPDLLNLRLDHGDSEGLWGPYMDPVQKEYEKIAYELLINSPLLNELIAKSIKKNDNTLKHFGLKIDMSNCGELKSGDIIKIRSQKQQKFVVVEVKKEMFGPVLRGDSAKLVTKYVVIELEKIKSYKKEETYLLHQIAEREKKGHHKTALYVYLCGQLKQKVSWGPNE